MTSTRSLLQKRKVNGVFRDAHKSFGINLHEITASVLVFQTHDVKNYTDEVQKKTKNGTYLRHSALYAQNSQCFSWVVWVKGWPGSYSW